MMATQSLDATSAQWWNGDAFRTRVFDALSLIIPAGEQFLLETVDEWLGDAHLQQFSYPRLREQSQRFLAEGKKNINAPIAVITSG